MQIRHKKPTSGATDRNWMNLRAPVTTARTTSGTESAAVVDPILVVPDENNNSRRLLLPLDNNKRTRQERPELFQHFVPELSSILPKFIITMLIISSRFTTPLLLENQLGVPQPAFALSSNFDILFETQRQPAFGSSNGKTGFAASLPSKKAWEQLRKQQDLQDARLAQCEESGPDSFEQCFFYGTNQPSTTSSTAAAVGTISSTSSQPDQKTANAGEAVAGTTRFNKGGIPTW